MSQDQRKQREAQNCITLIRPNTQGGSAKNEIFNERHFGLLQTAFVCNFFPEFICQDIHLSQMVSNHLPQNTN
jgi:hypothetical protein